MMAYAGSGRCGVLDKVAVLSCDCTRLVSCICSKIQCPNADSVRFWIDSHNMQLGCNKIRSELTIIYRGTLAYCRAVRKCTGIMFLEALAFIRCGRACGPLPGSICVPWARAGGRRGRYLFLYDRKRIFAQQLKRVLSSNVTGNNDFLLCKKSFPALDPQLNRPLLRAVSHSAYFLPPSGG